MAGMARVAVDFSVNADSLERGMKRASTSLDKFAAGFAKKFIGTAGVLTLVDRLGEGVADVFAKMNEAAASGQALSWVDALAESYIKFAESLPVIGGLFRALDEAIVGSVTAQTTAIQRQNDLMQKQIDLNRKRAAEAEKASQRAVAAARREQKAVEDAQMAIIVGLRKEIIEFGMSAEQIKRREAVMSGMNQYALAYFDELQSQLTAMQQLEEQTNRLADAQDRYNDSMQSFADSLFQQTRTPFEQLVLDLNKLEEAYRDGLISEQTYRRARKMYEDQYDAAVSRNSGPIQSAAGVQALNQLFTGRLGIGSISQSQDPSETTAKNTEAISDKTDTTNALLRELVAAVNSNEDAGVGF